MTSETCQTGVAEFILDDRGEFDDLLSRLTRVDDGIVRLSRREIVSRLRALLDRHRLVTERCLFLALAPGGDLLLSIRRYYAAARRLEAALDAVESRSPRSHGYDDAVAEARAAVDGLFEDVQRPLAALACRRLDAATLTRLAALAETLRRPAEPAGDRQPPIAA